jgi:cysteine desulfurase
VLTGGAQERGLRPGTQSAAMAAGFAVAAERASTGAARYATRQQLRDNLEAQLFALASDAGIEVEQNGDAPRAPHVSNLSWKGWRAAELCAALDLEGVAVSAGSACSAGTAEPSAVVEAMLGRERATSAVRVSLGEETDAAELGAAVDAWQRVIGRWNT